MINYRAILTVKKDFSSKELLSMIINWVQSTKNNRIDTLRWDGNTFNGNWKNSNGDRLLEVIDIPEKNIAGACLEIRNDTDGFFVKIIYNIFNHKIDVTVEKKSLVANNKRVLFSIITPPRIVRLIVESGYVIDDHDIKVTNSIKEIDEDGAYLIQDIMRNDQKHLMPIVIFSKELTQREDYNPNDFVLHFAGIAHMYSVNEYDVLDTMSGADINTGEKILIIYPGTVKGNKTYTLINVDNYKKSKNQAISKIFNHYIEIHRPKTANWGYISHLQDSFDNETNTKKIDELTKEIAELKAKLKEQENGGGIIHSILKKFS